MKQVIVASVVVLFVCVQANTGLGFFDELLGESSGKKKEQERQQPQSEGTGLLESLGGLLGADKKDIELFKKGVKTLQAMQPIEVEQEIIIGQAVAVEAFSRFGGEYQDESLTQYVNLVGRTVAEVSDRPELNYHFAILDSQEHNAFAAPGGYIFVTIGLMRTLKNEAELSGVLAHEVAHVTQRHMLNTIQRSAVLASASELTLTAMDKDPQLFSNVIDEMTEILFDKGLDKELEHEADRYGIEYAYRAGYNPSGLKDYLMTLNMQRGRAASRFFSTHPSTADRIRRANVTLQDYQDGRGFPFLAERFRRWVS